MPPSGFSQKAINGLLEFVKGNYEVALDTHETLQESHQESYLKEKQSPSEEQTLTMKINKLNWHMENYSKMALGMNINKKALKGLQTFVRENFKDLIKEIHEGKDKQGRPVTEGQAIQKEITQIREYLEKFEI